MATGAPHASAATVTDNEETDDGSVATSASSISEDEQHEQADFEAHPNVPGVSVETDVPLSNDKHELYRLHVRAGHLSFSEIRATARRGEGKKLWRPVK